MDNEDVVMMETVMTIVTMTMVMMIAKCWMLYRQNGF